MANRIGRVLLGFGVIISVAVAAGEVLMEHPPGYGPDAYVVGAALLVAISLLFEVLAREAPRALWRPVRPALLITGVCVFMICVDAAAGGVGLWPLVYFAFLVPAAAVGIVGVAVRSGEAVPMTRRVAAGFLACATLVAGPVGAIELLN